MKQYEYNVLTNRFPLKEELLNEVGKEGWELVSHTYTNKEGLTGWEHIYIFKREKEKVSTQEISAIEDKIKAIDEEIKEREQEIANAILRHKVWTRQVG
jgi:hypothetical protein